MEADSHGTAAAIHGEDAGRCGDRGPAPRLLGERSNLLEGFLLASNLRPRRFHLLARLRLTELGLLRAVEALGYSNVRYLAWDELTDCPTWVPPLGSVPVPNHNSFGLACDAFPANWLGSDGIPSDPAARVLLSVVMRSKRASATFWEIRSGESRVVTQAWWEGPQDLTAIEYVGDQVGVDRTFVTVKRGA